MFNNETGASVMRPLRFAFVASVGASIARDFGEPGYITLGPDAALVFLRRSLVSRVPRGTIGRIDTPETQKPAAISRAGSVGAQSATLFAMTLNDLV